MDPEYILSINKDWSHVLIFKNSPSHLTLPSPTKTYYPHYFSCTIQTYSIPYICPAQPSHSFPDYPCTTKAIPLLDFHFLTACCIKTIVKNLVHPFGFFTFSFFVTVYACLSLVH